MKRITTFVGPNGCGKSQRLVQIFNDTQNYGAVAAIINTPFSRFSRSRSGRQTLRISPYGIRRTVIKNLENFFDAEGRDTFDISDLLIEIGFRPSIAIKVQFDNISRFDPHQVTNDAFEIDALHSLFEGLSSFQSLLVTISSNSGSLEKSLRGRNRILFKYLDKLSSLGIVSRYELVFDNRARGSQAFSELSSGEQTLICTFLFIRSQLPELRFLLIDEPENSLHPQWQRKYLEFVHMAIGYHNVSIFLATHSPVLVSGSLTSYSDDIDIVLVNGQYSTILLQDADREVESVEQILIGAFDTITPANVHLSSLISKMTWDVQDGKITKQYAIEQLKEFIEQSYSSSQIDFINACIKVMESL